MYRILLVDDLKLDPRGNVPGYFVDEQAEDLRTGFGMDDCDIHTAHDVSEACDLLHKSAESKEYFDVVVTDMHMPIDAHTNSQEIIDAGMDVIRTARVIHGFTRLMVVTAYAEGRIANEAMKLGAFYFHKEWLRNLDLLATILQTHAAEVTDRRDAAARAYEQVAEIVRIATTAVDMETAVKVLSLLAGMCTVVPASLRTVRSRMNHSKKRNDENWVRACSEIDGCASYLEEMLSEVRRIVPHS